MSRMWVNGIALVLLLVPFVLISIGTTRDVPGLWWSGLALLALGGLIPPLTRFLYDQNDEEDERDDVDADNPA